MWQGEEKPTGNLRIKHNKDKRPPIPSLQQEWKIIDVDGTERLEWRNVPEVE